MRESWGGCDLFFSLLVLFCGVVLRDCVSFYGQCSDVKLVDSEDRPQDYPAMCARNNETLVPMPEEYL